MTYRFGFWNLENLFAPADFPTREPWIAAAMASDLSGWTEALFQTKVSQLASVISQMSGGAGPDIMGICEVENRFALDQLVAALSLRLPARDYGVVHADSTRDRRGIDTAFLFDQNIFTVDPATVFSHFVIRRTGTRDITQVTFAANSGHELIALCNHWPARTSGGAILTAGFRATAGETLAYWHQRIREERGNDIPIIAVGDFNDDPYDNSIRFNANASRERGDIERSKSARFYNLAWNYLSQDVVDSRGDDRRIDGTLYFRNDGNIFDQILVNRSLLTGVAGLTVAEDTVHIDAVPEMVDHRVNFGPIRFGLPKGNAATNVNPDGFSDHFPVSVTITDSG